MRNHMNSETGTPRLLWVLPLQYTRLKFAPDILKNWRGYKCEGEYRGHQHKLASTTKLIRQRCEDTPPTCSVGSDDTTSPSDQYTLQHLLWLCRRVKLRSILAQGYIMVGYVAIVLVLASVSAFHSSNTGLLLLKMSSARSNSIAVQMTSRKAGGCWRKRWTLGNLRDCRSVLTFPTTTRDESDESEQISTGYQLPPPPDLGDMQKICHKLVMSKLQSKTLVMLSPLSHKKREFFSALSHVLKTRCVGCSCLATRQED
ncbi:hypothetical protein EAF04_005249 [Stromatinia cepivora]|nr:hypothetical protein EAF04_005249 [Stromatinia cepivora]